MSADQDMGPELETKQTPFPVIVIQGGPDGYKIHGQVTDMGEVYKMLGIAQDFFRTAIVKHEKTQNVNRSGGLLQKLRSGRF